MILRIVIFCSICLTLISCASKNKAVVENSNRRDFVCGGNYDSAPKEKTYRAISTIELAFAVKNADTTLITELICLDSVKFTRAFNEVKVNEICTEMQIQGTTYFSAITNEHGGFEDVKVLRSVHKCFHDLEEKIKLKVGKMRILQEEYFNSEIVFSHKSRIY